MTPVMRLNQNAEMVRSPLTASETTPPRTNPLMWSVNLNPSSLQTPMNHSASPEPLLAPETIFHSCCISPDLQGSAFTMSHHTMLKSAVPLATPDLTPADLLLMMTKQKLNSWKLHPLCLDQQEKLFVKFQIGNIIYQIGKIL